MRKAKAPSHYHHGALREALLAAAEKLLRDGGVGALTLRAIARNAGVSHGAPAHHFEDLSALLSELAAVGFRRLVERLDAALQARGTVRFPLPKAYLSFAMENRALFALMFRDDRLDAKRPSLRAARAAAIASLSQSLNAQLSRPSLDDLGAMTAAWALTHGFAILATEGRLVPLLRAAPEGIEIVTLLEAAFAATELEGRISGKPRGEK
jgi:AcrR family transcriptional regulator